MYAKITKSVYLKYAMFNKPIKSGQFRMFICLDEIDSNLYH